MNLFIEIIRRRSAILVLGIFLTILGINAFRQMPRSLFPQVNYPRVVVEVNMGYAPLQTMEWGVTAVFEKELRAVPGVRLVKSSTTRGTSVIDVFLNETENVTMAIQRVNAKIAEARALVPPAGEISVRPITAEAFPAAEYCFVAQDKDLRKLRTYVEYTIRPMIMVIPGIFNTRVLGGERPELSVELDAKRLADFNLSVADVNDRLRNSNGVDFLGPIQEEGRQVLAFGGTFLKTPEEIGAVVVSTSLGRSVKIRDLGRVSIRNEWKTKDTNLSGAECVVLSILYQGGIDQKITSENVSSAIQSLVSKDPGLSYRSWDLNDFTNAATAAVLLDLAVGMVIIAFVTFFFLRSFRYSLIALLSMPLAACCTFLLMSLFGLSINLMTLGGLTAAIGLVVDNTVIVLEMYHHRRAVEKNRTKIESLVATLRSVAKPMIFGTATIALVFTPIGLLSGLSGMFFAPMAHVHTAALVLSVLIALLIVPALIVLIDRSASSEPSKANDKTFEQGRFARFYSNALGWILNRGKLATLMFVLIPLMGLAALPFAQTGFLPEWDEGDIVIDFRAESPTGLAQTVASMKPLEELLRRLPEVDFFIRKVGTGLGEVNGQPFAGEFIVKLKADRQKTVFELKDEISLEATKLVPGYEFDLFQILPDRLNDLSGSAKPIVLHIRSDSEQKMEEAAHILKDSLSKIDGLDSVRIEEPEKASEVNFELDERVSRGLEQNPSNINEALRFGLFSVDTGTVQIGPQSVPIRLRAMDQPSGLKLEDVRIYTTKGGLEKATQMGKVEVSQSRTEASHIDGTPVKTVTAELGGRDLGSVVKDVQRAIAGVATSDVHVTLAGDFALQQQSFRELIFAFLTGLALIFLTVLLFSNRLKVAASLASASVIPPVVGLMGCVIFRIPLDVSSFSGLISVTGIAVANSFMALSAIEEVPDFQAHWKISIHTGMVGRLRPILMTNIAAMAGFAPIAMGLAQGDEILRPFSIAIICGLFGTIYSILVVVPALYLHFGLRPLDDVI